MGHISKKLGEENMSRHILIRCLLCLLIRQEDKEDTKTMFI